MLQYVLLCVVCGSDESQSERAAVTSDYTASLQQLQDNIQTDSPLPIIVHRGRLLQSTLNAVRRPNFSYDRLLDVQFVGEEAENYGGPRREFLRYIWYKFNMLGAS